MKPNKTQYAFVKSHVDRYGYISRNFCLDRRITRLAQYAGMLKKDGYNIYGNYVKTKNGKDFVYSLIK